MEVAEVNLERGFYTLWKVSFFIIILLGNHNFSFLCLGGLQFNFDGSDLFGAFTWSSNPASTESTESPGSLNNVDGESLASSNPRQKEGFQVKSGIWADSLSRGLIDLNISAPKKVSLVDVGVVGDLTDGLDERENLGLHLRSYKQLVEMTSSQALGANNTQFGSF
ncbi:hypothetical protein POTOM_057088 [Populus tomentosa]|uniref:Uncharacterized protein n=1 Tax=Populus tomentosa TaxID=118781 RepID=A0A8X8C3K5_POPTO|nr:hypothetical protein POTOM_057088 [Populus tomentosa]